MSPEETREVLFVEDDQVVGENLKWYLERRGYQVTLASSAHEAVSLLGRGRFHCVITNMKMEKDNSRLAVIRAARRWAPGLPIIVLTAYPSRENEQWAKELGITGYFDKNEPGADVYEKVWEVVERCA